MVKISDSEWQEIQFALLEHHSLFYKMGEMGKPFLTDITPTACVTFSPDGSYINFLFNFEFWEKSTHYEKIFVICHECLHVILNHGKRFKDSDMPTAANIAMDIVVNHSLMDRFGFIRENISGWEEYCWVDTVFKGIKIKNLAIPTDETSEYYLNLLVKHKNAKQLEKFKTVDSHDFQDGDPNEVFEQLTQNLSEDEKKGLEKFCKRHLKDAKAGTSHGGMLHFVAKNKIKIKKKWESVIIDWADKIMQFCEVDVEQWCRKHRRFIFLEKSIFLPSDSEIEDIGFSEKKITVFFFLDISGSCWHLKDRFFVAAESLPKNRFDVRLFCFDTKVSDTDIDSRRLVGGGGTNFDIIESKIQHIVKSENIAYPKAVWIVTDGEGTPVTPEFPDRWFWFLTENGNTSYIDKKSHKYYLSDFV
jgi:hypothetical protein